MSFYPDEQFNIADYFLGDRIRAGEADRVAIVCGSRRVTYGQVAELASRFGHALRQLGVVEEQRVMVALPDGPEYAGAVFGVLAIGAVVVMVNPHLKPDEIAYFDDYTGARVAIVHADTAGAFAHAAEGARHRPRLLVVGGAPSGGGNHATFEALARDAPTTLTPAATHRDDPAIWLFSGGTTGRPKGVVQGHASFANTTELYAKGVLGYGATDVTLAVPKLFFGYALGSNLLFPFSVGATSVLFPERSTADELFAQIATHRPTILINVPTMVNQMVSHPRATLEDLSCLRFSTSAGEALPVELYQRWRDTFGVELLDGLGTAEMWHIFITARPGAVRPGTLGTVVPGFEVRACDAEGAPVGAGEVGELWVRGRSRAYGYWRQMERSMAAFRGEWYVSGDLIRVDADGYVTYCGRSDDMMKVQGKWVSPQEVENCLLRHPAVEECAVVGVKNEEGLTKPRAHVILKGDTAAGEALATELQELVRRELAPYKAPRRVVFEASLPRTHLGKVDRNRLRTSP